MQTTDMPWLRRFNFTNPSNGAQATVLIGTVSPPKISTGFVSAYYKFSQ